MSDDLEEIWLLYVDDGSQSLDGVERALALLTGQPRDQEAIGLLFRSMHTFKGNSRILGLANIEQVAHVSEDLVGIVRDEGVAIDDEIIQLVIEASDVLRSMMERAYRSRSDQPADETTDLLSRLKAKIARCRLEKDATPGSGTNVEEPNADFNDDDLPFDDALVFDATSLRLADDPIYREIFFETVQAAIDQMREAAASGPCAQLRERLLTAIDEVREMADRIAMPGWAEAALAAEASLRADADPKGIIDHLDKQLQNSKAGNEPADAIPIAEEICSAAQSEIASSVVDALRAVIELSAFQQRQDALPAVAAADRISAWATANDYPGIAEACRELAEFAAANASFDEPTLRVADFLSRLEGNQYGPVHRLLGEWSLSRTPAVLAEISRLVHEPSVDWARAASMIHALYPALAALGWHSACEAIRLLADLCYRMDDGDLGVDAALPALVDNLVVGLSMAIACRSPDGGDDAASADAMLSETLTAAGRMFRDPALAALEAEHGLPENFRGSLSEDSANRLRAAIAGGFKLHVIRADLGQNQSLADSFAAWLDQSARISITSVTVFDRGSTTFDFLIASRESSRAIRAGLKQIGSAPSGLSLIASLGQQDIESALPDTEPPSDEANRLSTILGDLAIARSATRQVLLSFVQADLPAQTDRLVCDRTDDPRTVREELSRLITGWHDKIEQLLQFEAKVATDLEQLSNIVASIRQRPASDLLDELRVWGHARATELGTSVRISCIGHSSLIDVSDIGPLEASLRRVVEHCLTNPTVASDELKIQIEPGEAAVDATVAVPCPGEANSPPGTQSIRFDDALALGLEDILSPVSGYATGDMQDGHLRIRIVIPRQSSMIDGMIVRVKRTKYVLPVHSIQRIVETNSGDIITVSAQSSQMMLRLSKDDLLPVLSLGASRPSARSHCEDDEGKWQSNEEAVSAGDSIGIGSRLYVIASTRVGRIAVPIDELIGQESIVVRPAQGYLASLRAVVGCTMLGAGDVGIVVDPNEIARIAA